MRPQNAVILVVEDDEDSRRALINVLEDHGFNVIALDRCETATEALRVNPRPNLIMLDLMMPAMEGWEFLQFLQDDPDLRAIPTLVMTAFPRENLRVSADVVLHKPLDYDRLISAVRHLIGSKASRPTRPAAV